MKKEKNKEMDEVFLLDRSGSMSGMEEDTIGGYNSYLEKQRKNVNTKITTILFDDQYEVLKMREDIKDVKNITANEYYVRGCTDLYDAIGKTIKTIENSVKNNKVLFVITTDGLENASREYNKNSVSKLIKKHKDWEFMYIGANIDSYAEGQSIGIKTSNIANYKRTRLGTRALFDSVCKATACYEASDSIGSSWKDNLEK